MLGHVVTVRVSVWANTQLVPQHHDQARWLRPGLRAHTLATMCGFLGLLGLLASAQWVCGGTSRWVPQGSEC